MRNRVKTNLIMVSTISYCNQAHELKAWIIVLRKNNRYEEYNQQDKLNDYGDMNSIIIIN